MTDKFNNRTRHRLIGLIFLGLAVRVVMPAGYMPAPIGEGGPFVLCPGGAFGASLVIAPSHDPAVGEHYHGAGSAGDNGANTWEFCPFGAVFGSAVLVSSADVHLSAYPATRPDSPAQFVLPTVGALLFKARAPPAFQARQA